MARERDGELPTRVEILCTAGGGVLDCELRRSWPSYVEPQDVEHNRLKCHKKIDQCFDHLIRMKAEDFVPEFVTELGLETAVENSLEEFLDSEPALIDDLCSYSGAELMAGAKYFGTTALENVRQRLAAEAKRCLRSESIPIAAEE